MKIGQKRTEPRKKMKKVSKKPVPMTKKRAWVVFSKFIRVRDCLKTTGSPEWGECYTCDEHKHISQLDAGHFVPKHYGNYFSERGVHAQCRKCNRYNSGKQVDYYKHLIEDYGLEEADRLYQENQVEMSKKFTVKQLQAIHDYYKAKLKELMEKLE